MKPILFVTGNKNKVIEAQKILEYPLEIADIDLDETQSLDINEVITKKAEAAYAILKKPLIVEDVGLYVKAWNGFPGPFIKFLHISGNNSYEMILKMLESFSDKTIEVKALIGYHDGEKVQIFEGSFNGQLVEKRGEHGWGFDQFVIPDGHDKTFGEMEGELKHRISHRAKAFLKFKKFLKNK